MKNKIIAIFLFCFLLVPVQAFATTYYVTSSGAGSQTGVDMSNAWSWSDFLSTSTPGGNDTVCISGSITTSTSNAITASGSGGNYLTIDLTGDGVCSAASAATINGGGGHSNYIYLNNKDYVIINGGNWNGYSVSGIDIRNSSYTKVENITQSSNASYAVYLENVDHSEIANNSFTFTGDMGSTNNDCIGFYGGSYMSLHNNTFTNWTHAAMMALSYNSVALQYLDIYFNKVYVPDYPSTNSTYMRFLGLSDYDGAGASDIWVHHNYTVGTRQNIIQLNGVSNVYIYRNIYNKARDWCGSDYHGYHTGTSNASTLTDALKAYFWSADELIGYTIDNLTDGSSCTITANSTTTVTCTLTGGTENDWDNGDDYYIDAPSVLRTGCTDYNESESNHDYEGTGIALEFLTSYGNNSNVYYYNNTNYIMWEVPITFAQGGTETSIKIDNNIFEEGGYNNQPTDDPPGSIANAYDMAVMWWHASSSFVTSEFKNNVFYSTNESDLFGYGDTPTTYSLVNFESSGPFTASGNQNVTAAMTDPGNGDFTINTGTSVIIGDGIDLSGMTKPPSGIPGYSTLGVENAWVSGIPPNDVTTTTDDSWTPGAYYATSGGGNLTISNVGYGGLSISNEGSGGLTVN